jgi:hypothetical protein
MSCKIDAMRESDRVLIEVWRIGYTGGDRSCLLDALERCFAEQWPIPPWVREGLVAAIKQVNVGKASNWDQVFGSAKARKTKRFRAMIAFQVAKAIKDYGPEGVDFDAIGSATRPPVSGSRAKQFYYAHYPESGRRAIRPRRQAKKTR